MDILTKSLIEKYRESKSIAQSLANGSWKNDPRIREMSIAEIEAALGVKKKLENYGINLLSAKKTSYE